MDLFASFKIAGVVKSMRELTSDKNKEWRGYVVTVQTLGRTFEVNVNPGIYSQMLAGSAYIIDGEFDEFNGRIKFIATTCNAQAQPRKTA
jgi:hypothetical protein